MCVFARGLAGRCATVAVVLERSSSACVLVLRHISLSQVGVESGPSGSGSIVLMFGNSNRW
jgi:hypothetical protein